jgi:hypothetical protein
MRNYTRDAVAGSDGHVDPDGVKIGWRPGPMECRAKPIHLFAIDGDTGESMGDPWRADNRGKCRYHIEPEYRTTEKEYVRARSEHTNYEKWFSASQPVWTDDTGEWGLRSFPGYSLTAIVHYCSDNPCGEFTGGLTGVECCAQCRAEASEEVLALHMLRHPDWYAKGER